jgi:hypothetical protein
MTDTFRTMIVPTAHVALARALGAGLSPGGVGMFATGLNATGTGAPTHFVSTGLIGDRFAECIASGETLHAACTEAGASVTRAQADALVAACDVSDEEPFAAFDRLGLRLVSGDAP